MLLKKYAEFESWKKDREEGAKRYEAIFSTALLARSPAPPLRSQSSRERNESASSSRMFTA